MKLKIGQKIKVNIIPGLPSKDFKVTFPIESTIVGIGNASKMHFQAILIESVDTWYRDSKNKGWHIFYGDIGLEAYKEYLSISGNIIDKKVLWLSTECFELLPSKPIKHSIEMNRKLKFHNEEIRIIGYSSKNKVYLVECQQDEVICLTKDIVKQMDVFWSPDYSNIENENFKIKFLTEKELLKGLRNVSSR